MWLWRLKNVPKEIKVWAILGGISLAVHVLLMIVFVAGYRNHVVEFAFTLHKSNPVFFVALPNKQPASALQPSAVSNAKQTIAKAVQKPAPSPAKPAAPKKEQAKVSAQKTGLATQETKKPLQKNSATKKPEAVKPESLVAKKEPLKKDTPKPVIAEPQKPLVAPKPQPIEPVVHKEEQSPAIEPVMPQNDVQAVTSEMSDQTMPREYYNLVEIIMDKWRAPYGIQGEPSCRIKAFVNKHGSIEDMMIEESSGILMFDIAARSALLNTEMPEWTRGKSFVITFKQ